MGTKIEIKANDQQWVGTKLRFIKDFMGFVVTVKYVGKDRIMCINEQGVEEVLPREPTLSFWELYEEPLWFKVGDKIRSKHWSTNNYTYYIILKITDASVLYKRSDGHRFTLNLSVPLGTFSSRDDWEFYTEPVQFKVGDFVRPHKDKCIGNGIPETKYIAKEIDDFFVLAQVSYGKNTQNPILSFRLQKTEVNSNNFERIEPVLEDSLSAKEHQGLWYIRRLYAFANKYEE